MRTDLSRCSKSPEVVVFNKWLSMELGHGVVVKLLILNAKHRLRIASFCEALQRQASPDRVNYVQQLKEMRRTMMKAAPLLLCSAEPICFAPGLTEGAPCAHWDPEASHVTPHWERGSKRGERFSLGCMIGVPARFRKVYFSSVPLRITERAARMFLLFFYILSQWKRKKRGMFLMKDSRAHPGIERSFA